MIYFNLRGEVQYGVFLSHVIKAAAKQLKQHPDIIVRRADKAGTYVVLHKSEYLRKLQAILDDRNKFERIARSPIDQLKIKINKTIKKANLQAHTKRLKTTVGQFQLGYIYGTVKTHKPGNPLRPHISQIPTPNYETVRL